MRKYAPKQCTVKDIKKLTNYLLDDDHPEGGPKRKYLKAFGFSLERAHVLKEALEAHPIDNELSDTIATEWGTKFIVDCSIRTPDGRNPCIRTVWQQDGAKGSPKLVTAIPKVQGT